MQARPASIGGADDEQNPDGGHAVDTSSGGRGGQPRRRGRGGPGGPGRWPGGGGRGGRRPRRPRRSRRPRRPRRSGRDSGPGGDRGASPGAIAAPTCMENVISINRVAKVVKGGRRFSFSAIVTVGDGKGHVGVAMGKANEIADAIRKARRGGAREPDRRCRSSRTRSPTTVTAASAPSRVLLKPAVAGTGVIAAGGVRAIIEAAGITQHPDQAARLAQPEQRGQGHDGRAAPAAHRRSNSPPSAGSRCPRSSAWRPPASGASRRPRPCRADAVPETEEAPSDE